MKKFFEGKLLQTRIYYQSQICYTCLCLPLSQYPCFCPPSILPCPRYLFTQYSLLCLLPHCTCVILSHQSCESPFASFSLSMCFFLLCLLCLCTGVGRGRLVSVYGKSLFFLYPVLPLLSVLSSLLQKRVHI